MLSFEPRNLPFQEVHKYLLGGVAPRPIAFVSTISADNKNNLSPFSFYNAFGSNPPIVAFSPSRRGRDGTLKDTYKNLIETKECVIHAVTYSMIEQVNLSSCEFESSVDEFVKSGFTPIESDIVKPKRVMESPFHMECRLIQMIELGGRQSSGNLAICEVLKFHIAEELIVNGAIDPQRIDHAARNGGNYYTRASGNAIFTVPKPGARKGIGFDGLPDFIKCSDVFSANNLGRFALTDFIPGKEAVEGFISSIEPNNSGERSFNIFEQVKDYENMLKSALYLYYTKNPRAAYYLELTAKCALESGNIDFAWMVAIFKGMKFDNY